MTWLRYAGSDYEDDVSIRLEDVVSVTVGPAGNGGSGVDYSVEVFYSGGQKMFVGTFSPDAPDDYEQGHERATARAEEIKLAVDKAKA